MDLGILGVSWTHLHGCEGHRASRCWSPSEQPLHLNQDPVHVAPWLSGRSSPCLSRAALALWSRCETGIACVSLQGQVVLLAVGFSRLDSNPGFVPR